MKFIYYFNSINSKFYFDEYYERAYEILSFLSKDGISKKYELIEEDFQIIIE